MYKIFIFTVKGDNKQEIIDVIKRNAAWYRFDDSSYILCSESTLLQLNNLINPFTINEKVRYLFLEVDIKYYKGRLPSETWDWIKKQIAKKKGSSSDPFDNLQGFIS